MCEEVSLFFNCRPALKSVYFLEIHPSLCLASQLYEGLERACAELCELHRAKTPSRRVKLEQKLLDAALRHWHTLAAPGATYSSQTQKDVSVCFYPNQSCQTCEV